MNDMKIKRHAHVELTKSFPSSRWQDELKVGTQCIVIKVKRKTNEAVLQLKDKNIKCYGSLVVNLEHLKLSDNQPVNPVKSGDIFYSSWGYEQTNIDFYEVVKVTDKSVFFRDLASDKTYDPNNSLYGTSTPAFGSNDGPAKRATLRFNNNNQPSFKVYSFAYAHPWNGQPMEFSETH